MIPCAHTMGTPETDLFGAAERLAALGFEAMEVICTPDYQCAIQSDWSTDQVIRLRNHFTDLNINIACLTPYLRDLCSRDREIYQRCMSEAKQVILLANKLGTNGIRMNAGNEEHPTDENAAIQQLVESLGELCEFAQPYGVELWVENHMGSLAYSASATERIVRSVGVPNIGIVYDQANLIQTKAEEYMDALRIQAPYIRHVHVKDAIWTPQGRTARLLGEGQIEWESIINELSSMGYKGFLCHEYERRWYPDDLPIAEDGMKKGYAYLTRIIASLGDRSI